MKNGWKKYTLANTAEMRPYVEGEILQTGVIISDADLDNGSPKLGDMIARNPSNHEDQWLVAANFFSENFGECVESNEDDADRLRWLECLEAAGVDNWDGYDYAREIYEEGK